MEFLKDIKKEYTYDFSLSDLFNCEKSDPGKYHCRQCNFDTLLLTQLKKHKEQVHAGPAEPDLKNFQCENCTFETHSSLLWLKHLKVKCSPNEAPQKKEWLFCELCVYKSTNKYCIYAHIRDNHSHLRWIECDHCKFITRMEHRLTEHKKSHVIEETTEKGFLKIHEFQRKNRTHECELCNYEGKTKRLFQLHMKKKHNLVEWYQCSECPYETKHKYILKEHILVKHTPPEFVSWVYCDECPYKHRRSYAVMVHKLRVHVRLVNKHWFQCKRCNFKSRYSGSVRQHYKRIHAGHEEVFHCPYCSFATIHNGSFKFHVKTQHLLRQNFKKETF